MLLLLLLVTAALVLSYKHCARRSYGRCELFMGDEYESVFVPKSEDDNDKEDLSGKPFTITITQDSFAIIAAEKSTVFARFHQSDNRFFVNITDHYAVPARHACPSNRVGQYEIRFLDHNNMCRVVKLFRIRDDCEMRKNLFGPEITLLKKPCRGPSDGICSIQERTVWVGEKRHDARSWFVFGGNNAYIETAISFPNVHTQYFGRVAVNDKSFHSRSSTSEASSTSSSLTFDDSMIAFTELASFPPGKECPLLQNTGIYRVKGLELTSTTLTDGTYSPLHGVNSRIHYSSSTSSSDIELKKREIASDDSSSSSSSSSSSDSSSYKERLSTESSVGNSYDERVYHRSSSKNNCGVLDFGEHQFVEDECDARKHRLSNRGLVGVDSCRGGVPPECTCNTDRTDCSEKKK